MRSNVASLLGTPAAGHNMHTPIICIMASFNSPEARLLKLGDNVAR